MSYWKSNVSKTFTSWALASVCVFLLGGVVRVYAAGTSLEENHAKATQDLVVTLSGLTAYSEFQEIRAALTKTEGVDKIAVDQEAPGFVMLRVSYAGEARGLIDSLETFFPKKYAIQEKNLPNHQTEISITK
jgi:hypothetical protein